MSNPFIQTVTKRRVKVGKKTLAGGTVLEITNVHNHFLYVSLFNAGRDCGHVGMGLPSLKELARTLTEIVEVWEEN